MKLTLFKAQIATFILGEFRMKAIFHLKRLPLKYPLKIKQRNH